LFAGAAKELDCFGGELIFVDENAAEEIAGALVIGVDVENVAGGGLGFGKAVHGEEDESLIVEGLERAGKDGGDGAKFEEGVGKIELGEIAKAEERMSFGATGRDADGFLQMSDGGGEVAGVERLLRALHFALGRGRGGESVDGDGWVGGGGCVWSGRRIHGAVNATYEQELIFDVADLREMRGLAR